VAQQFAEGIAGDGEGKMISIGLAGVGHGAPSIPQDARRPP